MEKEIFNEELIGIYFKKCYMGFGEVTEKESELINSNDFVCVVTEETSKNGYAYDSEQVNEALEIGKEYTFVSMDVGQSSSTLELKEFPGTSWNTVNFEIYLKED